LTYGILGIGCTPIFRWLVVPFTLGPYWVSVDSLKVCDNG